MPKYGLRFDLVETTREQAQLADFLRNNVGDYDREKHERWVEETCIPGIERDDRRALAWWQHGQMVGDVVLKPLGVGAVEIKNFRIRQGNEGVHLGAVMMSHAFKEAKDLLDEKGLADNDDLTIQLDTSPSLVPYFDQYGFVPTGATELYQTGKLEVIMQRVIPLH